MRKIYLLAAFASLSAFTTQAQLTNGTVLLGGSIGANRQKNESSNNEHTVKGAYLAPAAGVFIRNNLALGLRTKYGQNTTTNNNNTSAPQVQKSRLGGAGIFIRQYYPLGKAFFLFGEAGTDFGVSKTTQKTAASDYTSEQKEREISLTVFPGIAYAISKRFQLEVTLDELISLGYAKTQNTYVNSGVISRSESSNINFTTNLSSGVPLAVGFRFFLSK